METSGWMTGFMLEGLYTALGELGEGILPLATAAAAAEYCHNTLTNKGNNSWMGMLRQNATMTMESWTQPVISRTTSILYFFYILIFCFVTQPVISWTTSIKCFYFFILFCWRSSGSGLATVH